ncbi:MAG: hypothetical protein E7C49_00100 [Clostridium sp.]|nr:hypothetical protein [Clostridium sp.]
MNIPKYLYHYTSIDTLNLILTNKTIRFNSLPYVDDKEEKKTQDMGDFGRYCFISSWTDVASETTDLWERYGGKGKGIRIRMKSYPFKKYYLYNNGLNGIESYFKGNEIYSRGYLIEFDKYQKDRMLFKVEYSKDEEKLYPKLKQFENEHNVIINFEDVGKYKDDKWDVQQEWRYRIIIIPIDSKTINLNNPLDIVEELRSGKELPFTDYYLSIENKCLNDIEILLGPKTTDDDLIRVNEIVRRNNIKANVIKSKLTY